MGGVSYRYIGINFVWPYVLNQGDFVKHLKFTKHFEDTATLHQILNQCICKILNSLNVIYNMC